MKNANPLRQCLSRLLTVQRAFDQKDKYRKVLKDSANSIDAVLDDGEDDEDNGDDVQGNLHRPKLHFFNIVQKTLGPPAPPSC